MRLHPEVRKRLWHLVERCHERVRSQGNPKVSASPHRLEGWLGRLKPRARLTRGLKTETGALNFVCLMARGMARSDAGNPPGRRRPMTARNPYQRD